MIIVLIISFLLSPIDIRFNFSMMIFIIKGLEKVKKLPIIILKILVTIKPFLYLNRRLITKRRFENKDVL